MAPDYPRLALAGFALTVVLALTVAGSTSGAAFGTYNPSWDGTAEFRSLAEGTGTDQEIARNASVYRTSQPNGTLAVVLSPAEAYDERESAAVRAFVRDGGTLLVAEDFGPNGNRLLRDVGARARFDGDRLRDERNYENSPALPTASAVGTHPYTRDVDSLGLNHATAVAGNVTANGTAGAAANGTANETNATVLVESSSYAYLDSNGNDQLDDDETLASSPVVTVESVGEGRVVAVSDPSLFINTMLERADNRAFARNLYETHDRVVLDVSHAGSVPPLQAAVLTLRESPLLQAAVGGAALALVAGSTALVGAGTALRRRLGGDSPAIGRLGREEVVAGVRERHPDWDEARIGRVTQAIMDRPPEGTNDE
ncbi:protein of unknown function [Halomicrobium zhouii]|uniref:DUF4350 domain-containing protein n=1 Tax=Halomicrobium zhouii TaxID=767519 RepID=A0A1I6K7E2_9EURY|nr:DUF4350 domain-containing protein [Halomicrobium zhouii]SFR86988.1 protein of unknown function [Halomicrobium zhouii]